MICLKAIRAVSLRFNQLLVIKLYYTGISKDQIQLLKMDIVITKNELGCRYRLYCVFSITINLYSLQC